MKNQTAGKVVKALNERERRLVMYAYGFGRCEALNSGRFITVPLMELFNYCESMVNHGGVKLKPVKKKTRKSNG